MNGKYTPDFTYPMLITVNMTSDLKEFTFIVFKVITLYLNYISKEKLVGPKIDSQLSFSGQKKTLERLENFRMKFVFILT